MGSEGAAPIATVAARVASLKVQKSAIHYDCGMGYISEDGAFVYTPGFGSGRFGMPYDASTPQGKYHLGSLEERPFWARHRMTRRLTFLLYMERRAFQSVRRQSGSYIQRIVSCQRAASGTAREEMVSKR